MNKARITILGMTGAGKTCYIMGMYDEMLNGIDGYTIVCKNGEDAVQLGNMVKNINNLSLRPEDRFPRGTNQPCSYDFLLRKGSEDIVEFSWLDYPGDIVKSKTNGDINAYNQLKSNFNQSDAVLICIDGNDLKGNSIATKKSRVKRAARNISSFLADYCSEHNKLPSIGFLVTKYDVCCDCTCEDEILGIIKDVYNPLFAGENTVYISIIPVGIRMGFIRDGIYGQVEPINLHLPILWGIDQFLLNEDCKYKKLVADKRACYDTYLRILNKNLKKQNEVEVWEYFIPIYGIYKALTTPDADKIDVLTKKADSSRQDYEKVYNERQNIIFKRRAITNLLASKLRIFSYKIPKKG